MPSYGVSSTIFGSMRIIRTSSGRGPAQQRHEHRVDEARLAGAGGAGDEQVRHLREVRHQEVALDVLAQPDAQRVGLVARVAAAQHVAEPDHLAVAVGHLDADGRLAGDRREQPDVVGGHRVGDVALQLGDLLDLDGRAELDLVAGDGRAPGEAGDLRVDVELLEHAGDRLDDLVVGGAAGARRRTRGQQVARRQRVGRVACGLAHRETQLLADTVATRLGRRGGLHRRGGAAGLGGRLVDRGRAARRVAPAVRPRRADGSAKDPCRRRDGRRRAGSAAGSSGTASSARSSSAGSGSPSSSSSARPDSRRSRSGTSRSGVPMSSRNAYADRSSSTGTATHTVSPVASGIGREVADGAAALVPALGLGRQADADVHQAERAEREERRADHQPRRGPRGGPRWS